MGFVAMKEYVYEIDINGEGTAARFLRLIGRDKTVLEMGCSSGSQTRILKEQLGCSVTAVEINPEAALAAQKYAHKIIIGNIEQINYELELEGNIFDVIMFADVLEHLYDPAGTLQKIRPFLKEDGYIVATVPNFVHAAIVFEMANGRFDYRKTGLLDDTHIRFFTRTSIYNTFEKAGFQVVSLDRSYVKPENSEFATSINSEDDRNMLNYILKNNPESKTYHFIVKALPKEMVNATYVSQQELESLEDLAKAKQTEILRHEKRERSMKTKLDGITHSLSYRFMEKIRRFLP
jgi:2-polyprenyl-3-methyl-5-hydroxy-6-metoxy-1,4-benzoquinol methylase